MSIVYRGETFSGYNKPKRTSGGRKKSAGQGNTGNIFSANYWSRKAWSC